MVTYGRRERGYFLKNAGRFPDFERFGAANGHTRDFFGITFACQYKDGRTLVNPLGTMYLAPARTRERGGSARGPLSPPPSFCLGLIPERLP